MRKNLFAIFCALPLIIFCPLILIGQSSTNVAKGKSAKQSSGGSPQSGAASKAVDGNTSGVWTWDNNTITHTNEEKEPWWELDLGDVYNVTEIKIWNRTDDCCWNRLQNFYVMVSESLIPNNSTTSNQYVTGPLSFTSATETFKPLKGNAKGRYVRIFCKNNTPTALSLAEVEVMGTLTTPSSPILNNVAKGKSAKQSSGGSPQSGAASKAVDGNTSGGWTWDNNTITHTNEEKEPWWELDLGDVYNVSEIRIWNRTDDCCWNRLQNFYVMVTESIIPNNSTSSNQYVTGPLSFTSATETFMSLKGNAKGRYVRIFCKNNTPTALSLAEVEVFGVPATTTQKSYVVEMLGRQGTLEFSAPLASKPNSATLSIPINGTNSEYTITSGTWSSDGVFSGQFKQGNNPAVFPGTTFNILRLKQTTGTYALTGALCYTNSNSWIVGSTLVLGYPGDKSLNVKSTAKPLFALVINDKHAENDGGKYSYGWYTDPTIAVSNNFRMVHLVIDDVLKETALYAFENKDGRSEKEALTNKIASYKIEEIMANLNPFFSNVSKGDINADLGALLINAAQLKYPSKHLGLSSMGHGSPVGIMNGFFDEDYTIKRSLGWAKDIRGGNISFLDFGTNCNVSSLFNLSNVAPYVDFVVASDMTRNSPMPFSLYKQRPDVGGNYSGYFKDESKSVSVILGEMVDKYGTLFNCQESKDWAISPNPSPTLSKQQLTLFDMSQFPKILQNIGGNEAAQKCQQLVREKSTALESLYYNDGSTKYLDFKMAIPVLFPTYTSFF